MYIGKKTIPSPVEMSKEEISSELKKLIKKSDLTHDELSKLLGVKAGTIGTWSEGRRIPPQYVFEYVKEKIDNYLRTPSNNAEVIREMDDKDLAGFLSEVRDDALSAKGEFNEVSDEFQDFDTFLKGKELVRK